MSNIVCRRLDPGDQDQVRPCLRALLGEEEETIREAVVVVVVRERERGREREKEGRGGGGGERERLQYHL